MTSLSEPPIRSIGEAGPGQITATPLRTLKKLGINVLRVRGAKSQRSGRRGQ